MSLRTDLMAWMERDGWQSLNRGMPDLFMIRLHPVTEVTEVAAIVLNRNPRRLRGQQAEVMGILSRGGIPCYQWSIDKGLTPVPHYPGGKQIIPNNDPLHLGG